MDTLMVLIMIIMRFHCFDTHWDMLMVKCLALMKVSKWYYLIVKYLALYL